MNMPIDEKRFWSKVDSSGGVDACWPWTAGRFSAGYGAFKAGRSGNKGAHRVAWSLVNGTLQDGMVVRHVVCDNPPCCNPMHLAIGTTADNAADMVRKGRQAKGDTHSRLIAVVGAKGDRHGCHKLSADDVLAIRRNHADGRSQASLARQYGVTTSAVHLIVHRKKWAHLTEAERAC